MVDNAVSNRGFFSLIGPRRVGVLICLMLLPALVARAQPIESGLKPVDDGLLWQIPGQTSRIHFVGGPQTGYDVVFERKAGEGWQSAAEFAPGQVWNVYTDWRESWCADLHSVKVQKLEPLPDGRVRASAEADVGGQRWRFSDVYSFEHGMARIDRSFAHLGSDSQSKITLESRIRLPLGTDQRMLMPGVLYNNNPGSPLIGTKISTEPGGLGLYEEHRLPIPMVNVESAREGGRTYGSLVAKPSKLMQGHKGGDHWWSIGLEYGTGYVDLLSVSGPLATNEKKSQIYSHVQGFSNYDEAYLDVQGPVVFEKTLYLDTGADVKTGYAFRETLWKAFEVFRPVETPHIPFEKAMMLVAGYAKESLFCRMPEWKSDRASAVVQFGNGPLVDGDWLAIIRPDGKKDVYTFRSAAKQDSLALTADPDEKIIGIKISQKDDGFSKTIDQLAAAINSNADSPVAVEPAKILAGDFRSWGMRIVAKTPGAEGCKIGVLEQGEKISFTSNLCGPWGLKGSEPPTSHLVLADLEPKAKTENVPAGYTIFPGGPGRRGGNRFTYAWVGGNLGIAYGMLAHAERTGDQVARRQAIDTVQFFVQNAQAGAEGLYYGNYDLNARRWSVVSSRQYGENLEHLASLVELGRRLKLPEAEEWLAALRKAGDFLVRSPRYKGMWPRGWTPKGGASGWPSEGEPPAASISTAGAFCITPLARLAAITGDVKYREAAVKAMDGYWAEFGQTLDLHPWGATLDAGAEDKEAGAGLMRAALQVHATTGEPRFLEMAKDAGDWTLTWMFFHDVGMKPESGLLHEHLHTVGWTFISTQNQEIDVWGYWMVPDYYLLGLATGDERYKQISRVLFQAASQTISRPEAMFGPESGIQAEHYDHTNCNYGRAAHPRHWRGSQHSMGTSWATAGALYGGSRLCEFGPGEFFYGARDPKSAPKAKEPK